MGKFPGKPTRNSRKRISVRQSESEITINTDNVLFRAEANRISLGLHTFHYLFGTDEQVIDDFRGFTRKEVQTSIDETRKEQQTIIDLCRPTGLGLVDAHGFPNADKTLLDTNCTSWPITLHETFQQDIKIFSSPRPVHAISDDLQTNVSEAKLGKLRPKRRVTKHCFSPRPSHETMCIATGRPRGRPKLTHAGVLLGVGENMLLKNLMANKLLQKAKKSSNVHNLTPGTTDDSQQDKGGVVGVRKFVLPCRSAHSSRVIKPSKRCLESEEVLNEPRSNDLQSFVSAHRPRPSRNSRSIQTVVLKEPKLILTSAKAADHNLTQRSRYNCGNGATNMLSAGSKFSGFDRTGKHNSFQAPGKNNLSADGKGRWKPTYKVQLDLHELNVFGAGTSKFSGKQMRPMDLKSTKSQSGSYQINSAFSSSTKSSSSQSSDTDPPRPVNVDNDEIRGFDVKGEDMSKSTVISRPNAPILPCTSSSAPTCPSPNKSLGSKVVLRKARLQLDSKINSGNDTTVPKEKCTVNPSMPGTVVCGVCGAVRFYKFVKQARKFGIYCCESCRKFISKMMQKVKTKPPVLKCLGGDVEGSCKTVPIVRSHLWKNKSPAPELRSVYKARCPACWLKNCIRFFKMPESLQQMLSKMLPPNMQVTFVSDQPSGENVSNHELNAVSSKEDRKRLKKKVFSFETAVLKKKFKKVRHKDVGLTIQEENKVNKSGYTGSENKAQKEVKVVHSSKRRKEKKVNSKDKKESSEVLSKRVKGNKIESQKKKTTLQEQKALEKASKKLLKSSIKQVTKRVKKSANNEKSQNRKKNARHTSAVESLRRQRLELKGPRVKHVCRSALVVLGQPQATFPKVDKSPANTLPEAGVVGSTKKASKGSYCQDCDKSSKTPDCLHSVESNQDTGSKKSSVALADVTKNISTGSQADEVPSSSTSRKANKQIPLQPVPVRSMLMPRKLPLQEVKSLVSIDFWETYDPEEVANSGFGLIGSEPFHTRAICFLCGSAGIEKLIHCASCCDPYHRFCLYDGLRDPTMSLKNSKDEWRLDWLCQRCSVCHTCGRGSGPQLSCRRCHRTYHTDCLGSGTSRLHSPDRPWVCSACLRCNSCGEADVTQFVGNLPFCTPCFKLRKKGNYCPLCQKCYEDDDFDTKMMECGKCRCWVHAKCEDISDEKYLVLGFLPETVEFVCRMCCPLAPWRSTVEDVLKAGLKGVVQVLVKKCKTRHLLSLGPKKPCSCRLGAGPQLKTEMQQEGPNASPQHKTETVQMDPGAVPRHKTNMENMCPDAGPQHKTETQQVDTKEVGTATEDATEGDEAPRFSKQPVVCVVKVDSDSECNLPMPCVAGPEAAQQHDECGSESDSKKAVSLEELNGPLKLLRDKYNLKDCSVCVEKLDKGTQHSEGDLEFLDSTFSDCSGRSPEKLNSSLTPTDSGIGSTDDELKVCTVYAPSARVEYDECECTKARPTLLSMEERVDSSDFPSLLRFDEEMEALLSGPDCQDLANLYRRKLKDVFPWFDAKVSGFPCVREPPLDDGSPGWAMPESAVGRSVDYYYSGLAVEDVRPCALCRQVGDGQPCLEGRLLYCGQNEWAHANCALWSSEVFEEIDGSLQNVHSAVFRGRKLSCAGCGARGASVGCCARSCFVAYHFPCARQDGCRFMDDKTFYCPSHGAQASGRAITDPRDFDLRRPVYVELDRRKKKVVAPDEVRFMVGSLLVECLGSVEPEASDLEDAVVPSGFACTRLYWSAVEPWRIVQYSVRTVLPRVRTRPGQDHGRNVTVDHTLEDVAHKMADVAQWHRQLGQTDEQRVARQVMDQLLDAVCSRDVYENCLSDPQTELLPPELKDAIFEDLPHDLLDGISMQDIFPKMMSFEDCFSVGECKEEEQDKLGCEAETKLGTEIWFGDSREVEGSVEGEGRRGPREISRELKRSQSEVMSTRPVGARGHKRSCSLTWGCKLEGSKRGRVAPAPPAPNPRRTEEGKENKRWHRIPQVDGGGGSSGSEGGSPPPPDDEPVRCPRCHSTYRTRLSYERHLPTCSSDFILSTSESDSSEGETKDACNKASIFSDLQTSPEPQVVDVKLEETHTEPCGDREVAISHRPKAKFTYQRAVKSRGRPKLCANIAAREPSVATPPVMPQPPPQPQPQPLVQPAVIVQQVPSTNMMPAYLESFQQQTGHNLQYIASIDVQGNGYGKPQYIIPGTFQLQTAPDYGNLSLLPLGTIIQQPTCGVVGLGGVYTDQSGGMFLANQPVYYGLETIVSNTVMSSSQYVSGMVAASSSYSATTTQVYQTNKLETMMDPAAGYVIVPGPMSLPPPPPPPPPPRTNPPWAPRAYLPSTNGQPTPVHRPRPCYMPDPSPAGYQTPPRLKVVATRPSVPDRTPSFKYTVANASKREYQDCSSRIKQTGTVVHVTKDSRTPLILKPVCKVVKEPGEVGKPVVFVVPETKPPQVRRAVEAKAPPTDTSKSKAQSIKLVIQKTPQNGYYRISHHVPHNNVEQAGSKPTEKETKQDCKAGTQGKVFPLADNVKAKPAKRRWQPKEKPASQPKAPPCKMVYEVCSKDGFSCRSTSVSEVWEKVFEAVQSARVQHKMPPLLRNPFNTGSRGLQMLGLNHSGLRYLVEQLPGVNRCVKYRPLHHAPGPPPDTADDATLPQENLSGCCRTEPFASRAPYDLFSWLASRHRRPPKLMGPAEDRRASSTNLPMAMRFRHLKETSKEAVGVYRSHIHGRGLFCLRDIEAGEMVIEYAGEVIRSTLTDYRERLYNDKDIGCYMFRIDDHLVVDATMRGNAARFINHSCEPNCYSKVVDILGKKHILIFALRRIPQGEELTYDYKFPFEDVKIPCTCGSRRCRKYLN